MSTKSFFLILNKDVYVSVRKNLAVLYNTKNGELIEYNSNKIISFVREFDKDENLYCIDIHDVDLKITEISLFIEELVEKKFAIFIRNKPGKKRPIVLKPKLGLMKRKDKQGIKFNDNNIMNYLHSVTLFINSYCELKCKFCSNAFKQTLCCTTNNDSKSEISFFDIKEIVEEIMFSSCENINIIGGNIIQYTELNNLLKILHLSKIKKTFWINIQNINNKSELGLLSRIQNSVISVLISDIKHCSGRIREINSFEDNDLINYMFIIKSEEELLIANDIISNKDIQGNFKIKPVLTDKNSNFFQKCVKFTKEELSSSTQSLKNIYKKKVVNNFFFGDVSVDAYGDIYTNLKRKKLGNIKKMSLREAVYIELNHGQNWTLTRETIFPCNNCAYSFLCPSISNYEINENNLKRLAVTGCDFN